MMKLVGSFLGIAAKCDIQISLIIQLLVLILIGLGFTGCGPGPPPATQQEVLRKDVVGTKWHFRGSAPSTNCEITFNADGTYSLVRLQPRSTITNGGSWQLSGPGGHQLDVFPADRFSPTL